MSRRAIDVGARRVVGKVVFLTVAVAAIWVCGTRTARADALVLTGGSVSIDCASAPNSREATVNLSGPDFSLNMFISGFGDGPCSPAPVTLNLSTLTTNYDLVFGSVTFQGLSTILMLGSLQFDESSISGFVIGRTFTDLSAQLFRVDFSGTGVGSFGGAVTTFNVGAVPEPATVILFGTGMAAAALSARRRRKR